MLRILRAIVLYIVFMFVTVLVVVWVMPDAPPLLQLALFSGFLPGLSGAACVRALRRTRLHRPQPLPPISGKGIRKLLRNSSRREGRSPPCDGLPKRGLMAGRIKHRRVRSPTRDPPRAEFRPGNRRKADGCLTATRLLSQGRASAAWSMPGRHQARR